ncbi:MAG: hypothetical protein ACTSX7_05950 [Alphaproteobacteria bacterium]
MQFFEPDVLVEAEPGLAASIGYGALDEDQFERQLLSLDGLFAREGESQPEFGFGLSVRDAYDDIFQSQYQFVLRDAPPALIFNETKLSPIAETVFGAFPTEERAQQFPRDYADVFRPEAADLAVEHWFKYFRDGAISPFVPTKHKIEVEVDPRGRSGLSFFVFDHTKPADLIDYWNTRLFEAPGYPVPLCWLKDIAPTMVDMITRNHRPIPNNPSGIMFQSAVFFGRSLREETVAKLAREYLSDCPDGAFYRDGVWHPRALAERYGPTCERHTVKVDRASIDAEFIEGNTVIVDTLAPGFAGRYGGGHYRWANVVNLISYGDDTWALTYPSNLQDRTTPRLYRSLAERPVVTREGWVLGQQRKGSQEWIELSDGPSAIAEWLERKGIKAELSSAGRIAKQMLGRLGNLWDAHIIADSKIVELLNRMAAQEVVRGAADDATRRQFEGRTVITARWNTLLKELTTRRFSRLALDDFTKRDILKFGIGTDCPNCTHSNWYGLDDVDYKVTCERCLKAFTFPQDGTSTQWKYRVTGPFSVPNFAEGAYAVALTLNVFSRKLRSIDDAAMTYTTGLSLVHEDFEREFDFALWYSERPILGQRKEPRFVFGEAKSFADEAITNRDIESLKKISRIVPGAIAVVAVMKAAFSENEKTRLAELTRWGWKRINGRPRAQVLLLTGVELFADFSVQEAWKEAGEPYPKDADYWIFQDLDEFARASQKIHLELDYYAAIKEQTAKKK